MVIFLERLDGEDFLLGQVVILELFDLVLSILHPQDSVAVEIEGNCNLWHPKLSVKLDFVLVCIYLVHVFVLDFQLNGCVSLFLHKASLFWVGKAQKITILTPYIIVMECEHTILE